MLNSEHMAPYPEWMEHVPDHPRNPTPFSAGDDALAYLVYVKQGKSCCRGSLLQTI